MNEINLNVNFLILWTPTYTKNMFFSANKKGLKRQNAANLLF